MNAVKHARTISREIQAAKVILSREFKLNFRTMGSFELNDYTLHLILEQVGITASVIPYLSINCINRYKCSMF